MPSGTEEAQKIIKDFSVKNLDDCCRLSNFSNEVEESIRGHIHEELVSWLFYRKLAADCSRANISLHGFALLFERSAIECLADASWLEKYLIQRGGRCKPTNIEAPSCEFPDDPVEPVMPVKKAVDIERKLLEDLERLMALAGKTGNFSLCAVLDRRFLSKQTRHVKDMADLLQQTVRVSKQHGLGIFQLDRELRHREGTLPWGNANDPDAIDTALQAVCTKLGKSDLSSAEHGH